MKIEVKAFSGELPKVSPRLLKEHQAQLADNCRFVSGNLKAWRNLLLDSTPTKVGVKKTIHLYEDNYWFHWIEDVDVVKSPAPQDPFKRVYFTGSVHNEPRFTTLTAALTGAGSDYPIASYKLGIPVPVTVLTATLIGVSAVSAATQASPCVVWIAGHDFTNETTIHLHDILGMTELNGENYKVKNVTANTVSLYDVDTDEPIDSTGFTAYISGGIAFKSDEAATNSLDKVYTCTYQDAYGAEGPPSDPVTITAPYGQPVQIGGLPAAPVGDYNIANVRIYRTSVDGSDYFHVADVPVGTLTYDDDKTGAELTFPIPSLDYDIPPAEMTGIVMMPNGIMVGFADNEIIVSEPYLLHAFPIGYRQSTDYKIVGLGVYDTNVVVLTEGHPYILSGSHPEAMTLAKLDIKQSCVSAKSIVEVSGGVVWASPDGLVYVGVGGSRLLTEAHLSIDNWRSLNITSIHGYTHDGLYIGFYDTGTKQGGFVFDIRSGQGWNLISTYATAAFEDIKTDTLYLMVGDNIEIWDGGLTSQIYKWISKEWITDDINFGAAMITAKDFTDITFRLYGDDVLRYAVILDGHDGSEFRLPDEYLAKKWQFELEGSSEIEEVVIAESMDEI